jgi:macrolide-specific efflux system membrane fusion protein
MVLISVDHIPAEVKRGTVASASVILQKKENVVKIPLSFLHTYGDRNYVVVTDEQGKREVDVELGLRTPTEVEIVSGISAGITIIGR